MKSEIREPWGLKRVVSSVEGVGVVTFSARGRRGKGTLEKGMEARLFKKIGRLEDYKAD